MISPKKSNWLFSFVWKYVILIISWNLWGIKKYNWKELCSQSRGTDLHSIIEKVYAGNLTTQTLQVTNFSSKIFIKKFIRSRSCAYSRWKYIWVQNYSRHLLNQCIPQKSNNQLNYWGYLAVYYQKFLISFWIKSIQIPKMVEIFHLRY